MLRSAPLACDREARGTDHAERAAGDDPGAEQRAEERDVPERGEVDVAAHAATSVAGILDDRVGEAWRHGLDHVVGESRGRHASRSTATRR